MPEYQDAKTNFFQPVYLHKSLGSDDTGRHDDLLVTRPRPTGLQFSRSANAAVERNAGFFGFNAR